MSSRIQPDAPHPDSYRPDLPLRSELLEQTTLDEAREEGYDEGYEKGRSAGWSDGYDDGVSDGKAEGLEKQAARVRELEAENDALRTKLEKTA